MTQTAVYYPCSFVPPELIAACGVMPHRLVPTLGNGTTSQAEGRCAFTQTWLEIVLNKAKQNEDFVAVFTTSCDQMQRAFDVCCHRAGRNAFLLNVPSTVTEDSLNYYRQELERLRAFLCAVSGENFDESQLKKRMLHPAQKKQDPKNNSGPQIALTGGPVPASMRDALNAILETATGGIFFDAAEDMLIHQFLKFNPAHTQQDPFRELAARYFQLPAIWKRPNDSFYDWFAQKIRENKIDGIMLFRPVFCDLWHSQVYAFKHRFDIPVLDIDWDGNAALSASGVSRIQAFLETLAA